MGKRLTDLEPNNAKTDDRNRLRQIFHLKNRVTRNNMLTKVDPLIRNKRSCATSNNNALGMNNFLTDLKNPGINKSRIPIDKRFTHLIC